LHEEQCTHAGDTDRDCPESKRMDMTIRESEARWEGSLKEGSGRVRLGSGTFEGAYSFPSRFESGGGTNPEELIAAAHAGCFSMALTAILGEAGFTPTLIRTIVKAHLGFTEAGPTLTRIDIETEGEVPGIDGDGFQQHAEAAKTRCLVSRALAGVPAMTLKARLSGQTSA
jgi:osmotically inducible protein OsmC